VSGQPPPVTGPAVFGRDPLEALIWKPCCNGTVRLDAADLANIVPTVVLCDRPSCQRLWTVEFPDVPAGQDRVALWRLLMRHDQPGRRR
jgi:hypothetical protein